MPSCVARSKPSCRPFDGDSIPHWLIRRTEPIWTSFVLPCNVILIWVKSEMKWQVCACVCVRDCVCVTVLQVPSFQCPKSEPPIWSSTIGNAFFSLKHSEEPRQSPTLRSSILVVIFFLSLQSFQSSRTFPCFTVLHRASRFRLQQNTLGLRFERKDGFRIPSPTPHPTWTLATKASLSKQGLQNAKCWFWSKCVCARVVLEVSFWLSLGVPAEIDLSTWFASCEEVLRTACSWQFVVVCSCASNESNVDDTQLQNNPHVWIQADWLPSSQSSSTHTRTHTKKAKHTSKKVWANRARNCIFKSFTKHGHHEMRLYTKSQSR